VPTKAKASSSLFDDDDAPAPLKPKPKAADGGKRGSLFADDDGDVLGASKKPGKGSSLFD
jgi:hypothetical protein